MDNSNIGSGFNSMASTGYSNNQLSKEPLIGKLDNILSTYTLDKVSFCKELEYVVKLLRRKRREFNATRFFVLVVGPVKSGKSTLVNIFAREYVSPTAYKECTALPTIIGKSRGEHLGKIVQYIPTDNYCTDEAKKETFDYIVDVIREVENQDVLNGRVSKKISELTADNIKNIITLFHDETETKDDLIVSIGIEGGGFIDDEIMLIDMPGLDGSLKHQDNTLVYSNMAQRADAVFFVQSTTSAINKASIDFLNSLFKEKKGKVPVWLIHNIHDSQYFLQDDDKRRADIKEQVEIGRKRVQEGFGISRFDDIVLNLGKIYTAINEPHRTKPEYQDDIQNVLSEYQVFEKQLIDTLKNERQKIKDEINIGKTKDAINESIEIIAKVIDDLNQQKQGIINNIKKIKALPKLLDDVKIYDHGFLTAFDNLLVSESIEESWKHKIDAIFNTHSPQSNEKIRGAELKAKIDRITDSCTNALPVNIGTQFRTKLCNTLNDELITALSTTVNEIEACLQELLGGDPNVGRDITQLIADTLKAGVSSFIPYYSDIVEHITILGFDVIPKKYSKEEHREYLEIAKSDIKENIPQKLAEYKGIVKDCFKSIKDKHISELKAAVSNHATEYEAAQKIIIEDIDNKIILMKNFIQDLNAE